MKYLIIILLSLILLSCASEDKEGATGSCKANFHFEKGVCVSDTKMVDCVEDAVLMPANSEYDKKKTELKWNKPEKKWSGLESCSIKCKEGYKKTTLGCER